MKKVYFILFLVLIYKSSIADECPWNDSCYKRPPLIVRFTYGFHINLQGQPLAGQSLFYNVIDEQGIVIVKNTPIINNRIDFNNNFDVEHLDSNIVYNQTKECTLIIYGGKSSLRNGNTVNTAIPLKLSLAISGFYADEENGGEGNILDYKVHGQVNTTFTINKNFKYSFTENKNDMWLAGLNNKDHKVYPKAWNKNNPNNPNIFSNKVVIDITLPYTMPFISIKDSLIPTMETKYNKFY